MNLAKICYAGWTYYIYMYLDILLDKISDD